MTRRSLPAITRLRDGVIAWCMIDIRMLRTRLPAPVVSRGIWRHSVENKSKSNLRLGE